MACQPILVEQDALKTNPSPSSVLPNRSSSIVTGLWENLGDADAFAEQQARQAYQDSPIVRTVKKLLEQRPEGWTGTAQQLLDAGTFIARTPLAPSARDLSAKLKQMGTLFFQYDNIVYERKGNGTGGGKHTFHYPPQFEELPQSEIIPFPE